MCWFDSLQFEFSADPVSLLYQGLPSSYLSSSSLAPSTASSWLHPHVSELEGNNPCERSGTIIVFKALEHISIIKKHVTKPIALCQHHSVSEIKSVNTLLASYN